MKSGDGKVYKCLMEQQQTGNLDSKVSVYLTMASRQTLEVAWLFYTLALSSGLVEGDILSFNMHGRNRAH